MSDPIDRDDFFRSFLDGDLDAEEEREALHMIADDDELRQMLRFERWLAQTIEKDSGGDSFSVPEGFTEQVMQKISTSDATAGASVLRPVKDSQQNRDPQQNRVSQRTKDSRPNKWTRIISPLLVPRQIQVRPVMALAAVLIISVFFNLFFSATDEPADRVHSDQESSVQIVAEQEQEVWIRFVFFDDEAESVAVAGDFSDWDPVALDKEMVDGRTVWTGLVPVLRGEQRYMFVKDGEEWVTDPLAETKRDDGFGNKNAVLYL